MTTSGVTARQPFVSRAPRLGYVPAIDGIRGLGVLLVVMVHGAYYDLVGFAGVVDWFFVASGFLITTLVIEERQKTGRINFRQFYIRRALRLFPVMYLLLLLTLIFGLAFGDAELRRKTIEDVAAGATYVYHVVFPVGEEFRHSAGPEIRPLIQLWSLSVEEHFYLIAPAVALVAITRNWARQLIVACVAAWAFITVARATGHVGPVFAWYQRPDSLMLGMALAFVHAMMPPKLSPAANKRLVVAGSVATLALMLTFWSGTIFARPVIGQVPFNPLNGQTLDSRLFWGEYGFSVTNVCVCLIVLTAVRNSEWFVARFLRLKPWIELGKRSYTIYILHVPLGVILGNALEDHISGGLIVLIYLVLLVAGTELIHVHVERRFIAMKSRFAHVGSTGADVVAATTDPGR
jgi:peptidoglycan/LPS O-acetylase OafA/YrhL